MKAYLQAHAGKTYLRRAWATGTYMRVVLTFHKCQSSALAGFAGYKIKSSRGHIRRAEQGLFIAPA